MIFARSTLFVLGLVCAQAVAVVQSDTWEIIRRAQQEILRAEAKVFESCGTPQQTVQIPEYDIAAQRERTGDVVITVSGWTGGCIEGKRDGTGTLTWTTERTVNGTTNAWSTAGRFVKGRRVGMWCVESYSLVNNGKPAPTPDRRGCATFEAHDKPVLQPTYRKQTDGSWREVAIGGGLGASTLPAGALEAQSEKLIAAALDGQPAGATGLQAQSQVFDDLLPRARITLAVEKGPLDLKDKRVVLVLSSRTIAEAEKFRRERDALMAAIASMSGAAAQARARFVERSNLDRWLGKLASLVRRYAKSVKAADDLTPLQKGTADYALVFDWESKVKLDGLGKFAVATGAADLGSHVVQAFLVNRELKAVRYLPAVPMPGFVTTSSFGITGDHLYMDLLATSFGNQWGNTPEEDGFALLGIQYMLEGK